MAKSTLEKLVTKKVANTKKAEADAAAEEARKKAEYQAKLPKTREEMAQIIYPSITDGGKWEYVFAGGQWRLCFKVGKFEFSIYDEYIPPDSGTPTEGYYGHDGYWAPYLFIKDPTGGMNLCLGRVEDVNEGYVASRNDPPSKREDGSVYWDPKEKLAEAVKKTNDGIAAMVEACLLHDGDWHYFDRFRPRRW